MRRDFTRQRMQMASGAMGKLQGLHVARQAHWVCMAKALASQIIKSDTIEHFLPDLCSSLQEGTQMLSRAIASKAYRC